MAGMGVPDLISAPIMAQEAGIESVISTVRRLCLFVCLFGCYVLVSLIFVVDHLAMIFVASHISR